MAILNPETSHTVYVLHTGFALVDVLKPLFQELIPDTRIVNLVDDSLLADVRAAGRLTPAVTRRILGYAVLAQSAGASALFSVCSSVGGAAALLPHLIDIPIVRIDRAMAEHSVRAGTKIAVVATLPTTLDPTEELILECAAAAGRDVRTARHLAPGAFDALMAGHPAAHDQLLSAEILRAAAQADAVVLAQGSMARLVPLLQPQVATPLFSSPRSGVERLREVLHSLP